jgi:hypothetical protein
VPAPPKGAPEAAAARQKACFTCLFEGQGNAEDHGSGSDAWLIPSGYMHFHHHTFAVFPIGKDLYWYENTADMAYPPKVRTAGGYVVSSPGA